MNTPANRTVLYMVIIALLASAAVGVNSIIYANSVSNKAENKAVQTALENQRHWCKLLVTLDDGYKKQPPESEPGKVFAQEINELRVSFGC